jgi:hypothetical protein
MKPDIDLHIQAMDYVCIIIADSEAFVNWHFVLSNHDTNEIMQFHCDCRCAYTDTLMLPGIVSPEIYMKWSQPLAPLWLESADSGW